MMTQPDAKTLAGKWIDQAAKKGNTHAGAMSWILYDLVCGYRKIMPQEVKDFLAGLPQTNAEVKAMIEYFGEKLK